MRAARAHGRKVPHCSSSDGTYAQCREQPGQVFLHMENVRATHFEHDQWADNPAISKERMQTFVTEDPGC